MEISNYDEFGYDYSTYWKERAYENEAEHIVLNKTFQDIPSGNWFLDIGGSYGRLADTYYDRFKHPIILDYSYDTLKNNYSKLKEEYPKLTLIAANAYKLPFAESSLDAALMVRVLHHLNEPDIYFKEISRVLKSGSTYIQEFANKVHIKAKIRALFKGDFKFFSKKPYQQPAIGNFEGTENQQSIFLNYHPKHIKQLFKKNNITISHRHGCSYLRIPWIKERIKTENLLKIEKVLQKLLSWSNISPSIFFTGKSNKPLTTKKRFNSLEDILVCPRCKNSLHFSGDIAICRKCQKKYYKKENIWDFRTI